MHDYIEKNGCSIDCKSRTLTDKYLQYFGYIGKFCPILSPNRFADTVTPSHVTITEILASCQWSQK